MKLSIQKLDSIAGSQNYGSESKLELVRIRVEELIENNNNLRDYLSDKEATKTYKYASSVCCDSSFRIDGNTLKYHVCDKCNKHCDIELKEKEASKGECCTEQMPHFHRTGCSNPEPHKLGSLPCCKGLIPPQQEECTKCGKKMEGMYCCDLSPQEALDIIKDVKPEEFVGECLTCGNPVRSGSTKEVCVCPERKPDGSWKPQLKEESPKEDEKENQPQPDSKVEMVRMDLVNKHYVSKVKIKDVLRDVKDGGEFYTRQAVNEIFEKLGLKEL